MIQRSFSEIVHALTLSRISFVTDWLKVDFWIQGPVAADTSDSGTIFNQSDDRRHPVFWILIGRKLFHCAMYLLPLDLVSKNQLSTNQNLFNARATLRNYCWTCIILLDMYRLA